MLLVSSVLLAVVTAGAGVFTLALGLVHLTIPRIVGYRAALAMAAPLVGPGGARQRPSLPTLAAFGRAYRLRPDDLIGITWVMSNAASYVLITIGLIDLGWALGWRGVPVGLGASWIAGWWGLRAASQFALGRRTGDVLVAAWFASLAVAHVVLALAEA